MTATIYPFARKTPATPPAVEASGSESGAPTHGHGSAPLTIPDSAQLVEDHRHYQESVTIRPGDGSYYRNSGYGWDFYDRAGRCTPVTITETADQLTAWVKARRLQDSKKLHPSHRKGDTA